MLLRTTLPLVSQASSTLVTFFRLFIFAGKLVVVAAQSVTRAKEPGVSSHDFGNDIEHKREDVNWQYRLQHQEQL